MPTLSYVFINNFDFQNSIAEGSDSTKTNFTLLHKYHTTNTLTHEKHQIWTTTYDYMQPKTQLIYPNSLHTKLKI